jgi:uroporphyrinogen decarboxylase
MSGRSAMTSRERVLASVEHREPDHLAVDLGSTPSSGISAVAHSNLVRHLGLGDQRTRVYDVVQQLAQPSDELLDRLRIDAVTSAHFDAADEDWRPMTLPPASRSSPGWFHPVQQPDGAVGRLLLMVRSPDAARGASDQTVFPYVDGYPDDLPGCRRSCRWCSVRLVQPPGTTRPTRASGRRCERTMALRASTDRALMVVGLHPSSGASLRRIDNFLMDLVVDQANVSGCSMR